MKIDKYSDLTLEDLLVEESKLKRSDTLSSLAIGFLVGVMIYGIANKGFGFIYIFIPCALIYANHKNAQRLKAKLKNVQTKILDKKKAG